MSTNGLPPAGGLPQNQPFHPQSQKMPMQQPWNGGSAGSSGKTISTYLELAISQRKMRRRSSSCVCSHEVLMCQKRRQKVPI